MLHILALPLLHVNIHYWAVLHPALPLPHHAQPYMRIPHSAITRLNRTPRHLAVTSTYKDMHCHYLSEQNAVSPCHGFILLCLRINIQECALLCYAFALVYKSVHYFTMPSHKLTRLYFAFTSTYLTLRYVPPLSFAIATLCSTQLCFAIASPYSTAHHLCFD